MKLLAVLSLTATCWILWKGSKKQRPRLVVG